MRAERDTPTNLKAYFSGVIRPHVYYMVAYIDIVPLIPEECNISQEQLSQSHLRAMTCVVLKLDTECIIYKGSTVTSCPCNCFA